jgi:hypothetical protein
MVKLFGKSLFEKKATPKLYDWAQHGILRMDSHYGEAYIELTQQVYAVGPGETAPGKKIKKPAAKKEERPITPKELFELKTLNKPAFAINCDPVYIDGEVATLKAKLEVLPPKPRIKKPRSGREYLIGEGGAVSYGRQEVESMIERLTNRKLYEKNKKFFEEYPYTTNDAIREVLANHKKLEAITVDSMVPDLPADAIQAIKDYQTTTQGLCGKHPVFYLIREKAEQASVARKRDPILLAQSPFGFFWQILGAWDKEVVLLEEL